MDSKKAQSCLKTFLEVSKIQIDIRNKSIKRKNMFKSYMEVSRISQVNEEITALIEERDRIQGKLDSVKLEMLDMIEENPNLVSGKLLSKKGYTSVGEFIKEERESIAMRNLARWNPFGISDVLDIALKNQGTEIDFSRSLFDKPQTEVYKSDITAAVDTKNVKTMIKTL